MIPVPASSTAERPQGPTAILPPGVLRSFALVSGLFFLWGVPGNLNDVLIRQFMKAFAITRFEAGLVQSAFYLGYFLLALPAGLLIRHKGYKAGFLTGLTLFASGCFLFLPAAASLRYPFFLAALFVMASGLAFLETAANPFVAQLGPSASSERRLNIAQAFNPLGSIAGVLLGTRFIFSGVELSPAQKLAMQARGTYAAYLRGETERVVMPYMVLGALALVWAVMLASTRFPAFIRAREERAEHHASWRRLLMQRPFLFALVTQFMYVGAQVGTWSYFIQYCQEYGHVRERTAGLMLTGTLAAFGLGRLISASLMQRFAPTRMMATYAAANIVLLTVANVWTDWTGIVAVLLTSFFMSMMFPTIFALGLKNLGANTNLGGSLLVMTIIGGAVLTPVMGRMAEWSTARAYLLPLAAYLVVAAYALYMQRVARAQLTQTSFEV